MALSPSITRTFRIKPEVDKIFDDLEAWLDHCRLELIDFNPAHLYKSQEYKAWARTKEYHERKAKREAKARK